MRSSLQSNTNMIWKRRKHSWPGTILVLLGSFFWTVQIIWPSLEFLLNNCDQMETTIENLIEIYAKKAKVEQFIREQEEVVAKREYSLSFLQNTAYLRQQEETINSVINGTKLPGEICPGRDVSWFQRDSENLKKRIETAKILAESHQICQPRLEQKKADLEDIINRHIPVRWELLVRRSFWILSHVVTILLWFLVPIQALIETFYLTDYQIYGKKIAFGFVILLLLSILEFGRMLIDAFKRNDGSELQVLNLIVTEDHFCFCLFHIPFVCYTWYHALRFSSETKSHEKIGMKSEYDVSERLFQCCTSGTKEQLKEINRKYQHEIDINEVKKDGNTAFHLAVNRGQAAIVRILIANYNNVDISIRNNQGKNVIDLAVISKNLEVFNLVIQNVAGVKPNLSSLYWAVKMDQGKMVRILLTKWSTNLERSLFLEIQDYCCLTDELRSKALKKNKNATKDKQDQLAVLKTSLINRLTIECPSIAIDIKDELGKRFQCTACQEDLRDPLNIYSCSKDHYFCSNCLQKIKSCPRCKENFKIHIPTRRRCLIDFLVNDRIK